MKKEIAGFKFIVENGFASELPEMATVSVPVVEEEKAVKSRRMLSRDTELVNPQVMRYSREEDKLDVPEFMKNYKEKRGVNHAPKSNVIHVDFGKEEEREEVVDKVEQVVNGVSTRFKKAMRPVLDYFFGEEE